MASWCSSSYGTLNITGSLDRCIALLRLFAAEGAMMARLGCCFMVFYVFSGCFMFFLVCFEVFRDCVGGVCQELGVLGLVGVDGSCPFESFWSLTFLDDTWLL